MQKPIQLDRANNAYFVVTLSPSGSIYSAPAVLAQSHPALKYEGRVGELDDTHIYSSPLHQGDVVTQFLKERRDLATEGITHIEFPQDVVLEKRSKKREEL